jgi:hypothetical protein
MENVKQKLFLNTYDFSKPDLTIELPKELEEISGISLINDSVIAAISDEKPFLYLYHLKEKRIVQKTKIQNGNDFEDVCICGDAVFILQSNGILWKVKNYNSTPIISSINLPFEKPFELEGMCQNNTRDSLFIAAKYWHQTANNKKNELPVWAFSIVNDELKSNPILPINSKVVFEEKKRNFQTSAIAKIGNPNYWLAISTNDKYIVALDGFGEVKSIKALDPQIFTQPEGITIDNSGTIYISNEDKNGVATILKFVNLK